VSVDRQYPIGRFRFEAPISASTRQECVDRIATQPLRLRSAVEELDEKQLDTPYRDGGWTVRQVVHHVADSHLNAYCRCRLALTEDRPTIKPYDQARWAESPDYGLEVEVSLVLLAALHQRWVELMRSLRDEQFQRSFFHPEDGVEVSIERAAASYAWHGDHHIAQINALRARRGW